METLVFKVISEIILQLFIYLIFSIRTFFFFLISYGIHVLACREGAETYAFSSI